jgi:hypothetical protein
MISETWMDMISQEILEINRSVDHVIPLLTYRQWNLDLNLSMERKFQVFQLNKFLTAIS